MSSAILTESPPPDIGSKKANTVSSAGREKLPSVSKKSAKSKEELPKHDKFSEQCVIGCALNYPKECVPAIRERLKAGSQCFYEPRHRLIYDAILALENAGTAIDYITVNNALRESAEAFCDNLPMVYLTYCTSKVFSPENLSAYLETVTNDYVTRESDIIWHQAKEQAGANPEHRKIIWSTAAKAQQNLEADYEPNSILKKLEARKFDVENPPPDEPPLYCLQGVPIATAGNIVVLSANKKAGKSSVTGAALAASIFGGGDSCIGITAANHKHHAVILLDTEQSRMHHHRGMRATLKRAKVSHPPKWLTSHWIKGFTFKEARQAIDEVLKSENKKCGGVHSLLLDGGADFVTSVNNEEECNEFVNHLHDLAIRYNCVIWVIIHLNPDPRKLGSKTRGHFGSQLERKAETNLRIDKDDADACILYAESTRSAPIDKMNGARFVWSDEHHMHMLTESKSSILKTEEAKECGLLINTILQDGQSMAHGELVEAIRAALPRTKNNRQVSQKTGQRKLTRLCELGLLRKNPAGYYEKATY